MQRLQKEQLQWLEFDLLSDIPNLKHAVYLRQGGFSQGAYHSLNVGRLVGDDENHVKANLGMIEKHLREQIPKWRQVAFGRGCHGKEIALVDAKSPEIIPDRDGLICATPGMTLMMTHADCQIAFIYDPIHHAIANVHAGWRGSAQNIFAAAIEKMKLQFGSNPADLLVCISPSLGPYEAEFMHYRHELPEEFWTFQVRPTYFDFWAISEFQLQNAGILPHHIEIARLSTYSNPHDYFSHRRDKITGRHAACITLLN